MSYIEENSKIWDDRAENNDKWSVPLPKDWFPDRLEDKKVLCLAGGGGQQGTVGLFYSIGEK